MRTVVMSMICCLGVAMPAAAVDRVVGVSAPEGGATLVKQFQVVPGTQVAGVEIVSNDLGTVFPAVRLRKPGDRAWIRGVVLCEVTDVAPSNGARHRFTVMLPRTVVLEGPGVLVEVVLPQTPGVEVIGIGAGLGALDLGGSPATSYIGSELSGELQAIDADLCMALVGGAAPGKAGRGAPVAGTPPSSSLHLSVHNAGGAAEVRLVALSPVAVVLGVYDVRGKLVRMLSRGELTSGEHRITWDRRDADGRPVAAGVYFVVARAAGRELRRKTVVLD
jgi:hypothetical protein